MATKATLDYGKMDMLIANGNLSNTEISREMGCSMERVAFRRRILSYQSLNVRKKAPVSVPGSTSYNYAAEIEKYLKELWQRDFPKATWEAFREWVKTEKGSAYLDARTK